MIDGFERDLSIVWARPDTKSNILYLNEITGDHCWCWLSWYHIWLLNFNYVWKSDDHKYYSILCIYCSWKCKSKFNVFVCLTFLNWSSRPLVYLNSFGCAPSFTTCPLHSAFILISGCGVLIAVDGDVRVRQQLNHHAKGWSQTMSFLIYIATGSI